MANRLVVKYDEKANAYSAIPSNSRAATGMAVPTAIASKAMSRTTETMPTLRARCSGPSTPPRPTASAGGGVPGDRSDGSNAPDVPDVSNVSAGATSASPGSRAVMDSA